jgi:hypothetical protein
MPTKSRRFSRRLFCSFFLQSLAQQVPGASCCVAPGFTGYPDYGSFMASGMPQIEQRIGPFFAIKLSKESPVPMRFCRMEFGSSDAGRAPRAKLTDRINE